jgi:hypothetical protein
MPSLEHYGASASAGILCREFGFTPEAVAQAGKRALGFVAGIHLRLHIGGRRRGQLRDDTSGCARIASDNMNART